MLAIGIYLSSCGQMIKDSEQISDSTSTPVSVEKDVTKCMPHDTTDAATGGFVKYVKYDTTYGLIVGSGSWQINWRDDIDCGFPASIVPVYQWSSDKVIALINGCGGNYCSKHVYFAIGTNKFYRRENVFAYDANSNLIAYFSDNYCVSIENINTLQKTEYTFTDIPACSAYFPCVEKGQFAKSRLTFDIRLVKGDKDQLETKTFTIPDNLYKN